MPVRRLRVALNLRTGMLRNEIVIHGKQATVCCTISSSYCSMSINELSWSTEQFNRSISLPNFKSILGRHVKVHVNKIILTHWQGCRLQQAALYNLSSGRCQSFYFSGSCNTFPPTASFTECIKKGNQTSARTVSELPCV